MRRVMALFSLGVAASASGCASASAPGAEPAASVTSAAAEVLPCAVPVPEPAREPWRQVRATGFTFCVPASWRPTGRPEGRSVDARTWRGGSGSITWGRGEYRPQRTESRIAIVRAGEPLPSPGQVRRFTEVIDGRPAELWDNEFEGKHYTGARWTGQAVYLEGEATDPATARLQLVVYRTVRFAKP